MTAKNGANPAQELEELSNLLGAFGPCDAIDLHLMALLGTDEAGHEAALDYLDSAVIYEGTPFPVTAAAGLAVAEILSDPRAEAVRPELLRFIQMVAECGTQFEADRSKLDEMTQLAPADTAVAEAVAAFQVSGDMQVIDALFENEDLADAILAQSILNCVSAAPKLQAAAALFEEAEDKDLRAAAIEASEELAVLVKQYS